MTSLFFVLKRRVLVSVLTLVGMQLFFVHTVLSVNETNAYLHHQCINSQGTYQSGSKFEKNLNNIISGIPESLSNKTFVGVAIGETHNSSVYARIQCRVDISTSQCRSCLSTAISEILKRCQKNKGRIIWYDYCVFEITAVLRWYEIDRENYFYLYNTKDVNGNKESFNKKTKALLYKLKEKATSKEKNRHCDDYGYAAGEERLGTMKLYAMVQCMQDLSHKNCSSCLDLIMAKLPECCNNKQGGRVLCTTCNFRYELYPFVKPLRMNNANTNNN